MRGLCSAKRPKRRPPCEVAEGFGLVEEFCRGGVLRDDGAAKGVENGDEKC